MKQRYIEHKGRVFRIRVSKLKAERVVMRTLYSFEETVYCPKRTDIVYAIQTPDGWRYAFANVGRKHVKKWLDYCARTM